MAELSLSEVHTMISQRDRMIRNTITGIILAIISDLMCYTFSKRLSNYEKTKSIPQSGNT